jgi:type I restriction enzyme, R subunit
LAASPQAPPGHGHRHRQERTAVSLVEVLLRARWAKRVLFLVDRFALRDQALTAFKEFLPTEPSWPQEGDKGFARGRRVYVATYPTMLNLIQGRDTPDSWISPHFFDLVVADESHRSIYNAYQQVLDHFNAIILGLTATPADRIDHDTFRLFACEAFDPTYAYTYEEAIAHDPPYLCDFEVLKVRSKFQVEGSTARRYRRRCSAASSPRARTWRTSTSRARTWSAR